MPHWCPQPFRVPVPSSLLQIWLSTPGHTQTGSRTVLGISPLPAHQPPPCPPQFTAPTPPGWHQNLTRVGQSCCDAAGPAQGWLPVPLSPPQLRCPAPACPHLACLSPPGHLGGRQSRWLAQDTAPAATPGPPGPLPVHARGAAAPAHQGPGVSPAWRRPHQAAKHPRGLLGGCCGFCVPHLAPCLVAFGEPRERAEHPRCVGTEEPPCCGWKGPKKITPDHNLSPSPVSPSPAAALGEPGQHGSAGELCQRRAGHAAEGARRRTAPAQGRPAASPGTGSAAPWLLQR